jgi:hypothetical protein
LETKPDEDMGEEGIREHRAKGEGFEDATEDTAEADKDETDEEDMVKQDEAQGQEHPGAAAGAGHGRGRATQSPWGQAGGRLPHQGHQRKPGREESFGWNS